MKSKIIATVLALSLSLTSLLGSASASGSMPATVLTGSVSADQTMQLKWNTQEGDAFKDFYQGYALFMKKSSDANFQAGPFALLQYKNNNYSYYNLKNMPVGKYDWKAALYYYDVNGFHYTNMSNVLTLEVKNLIEIPKATNPVKPGVQPTKPKTIPAPVTPEIPKNGGTVIPKIDLNIDGYLKGLDITTPAVKASVSTSTASVVLNWKAYKGSFDGYIVSQVELNQNNKELDETEVRFFLAADRTSFSDLNIVAGHKYRVQITPYRISGNSRIMITAGASNRLFIRLPANVISLYATEHGKGLIKGGFESKDGNMVDGYAVFVVAGKNASLGSATPAVYLPANQKKFVINNLGSGTYTVKVYAYNQLSNGIKVFHQGGSNTLNVSTK